MSLLRDSAVNDERLVRYLLGLVPPDEAERLDEQSIVDDDVACRLLSVENDLVDAYVRETLDPERRLRFELHYLASPLRRRRVTFARRFLAAVDRRPPEVAAPAARRLAWAPLAVAATLLLSVGALFVQNVNLRTGLNQALHDGVAGNRRAQELSSELDAARKSNARLMKALEEYQPAVGNNGRTTPAMAAAAIVLIPQTRSVGPLPSLAVAQTGPVQVVQVVPFDLRLESRDFPRYRAVLKDQDAGHVVWESEELAPGASAAALVSLFVPTDVLKPPHRYAFELSGVDGSGRVEAVGSYAFQIDPR
jgi:hypothetical protein